MPDPFSRAPFSFSSSQNSLFHRVRENFYQLLASPPAFPSTANGAPLHLLKWRNASAASGSRTISFLAHMAFILGMLFVHVQLRNPQAAGSGPEIPSRGPFAFLAMTDHSHFGQASLGLKSGGGESDPRPARHGLLAPGSSVPLLPPRRTVNPTPELPVPSSVFDPNAPQFPVPVTNLGLPWMKDDSNSAGPGKDHGFGSGKKGGMGDDEGPGVGQGDSYNGPYANIVTRPACAYCPDPQYTDEAREAKLQGKVTLRVLVGADGRASQIQIVQGIGMGLDDRAVQSVRAWKFVPAQDAARHTVPTWVTIEVVFRLI